MKPIDIIKHEGQQYNYDKYCCHKFLINLVKNNRSRSLIKNNDLYLIRFWNQPFLKVEESFWNQPFLKVEIHLIYHKLSVQSIFCSNRHIVFKEKLIPNTITFIHSGQFSEFVHIGSIIN